LFFFYLQSTQEKGDTRSKMEGPLSSQKTKESPSQGNHKGEQPFAVRSISNKERGRNLLCMYQRGPQINK
jgi:hypothetical protein